MDCFYGHGACRVCGYQEHSHLDWTNWVYPTTMPSGATARWLPTWSGHLQYSALLTTGTISSFRREKHLRLEKQIYRLLWTVPTQRTMLRVLCNLNSTIHRNKTVLIYKKMHSPAFFYFLPYLTLFFLFRKLFFTYRIFFVTNVKNRVFTVPNRSFSM